MCKTLIYEWRCKHNVEFVVDFCPNAPQFYRDLGQGCGQYKGTWYPIDCCCSTNCCQRQMQEAVQRLRDFETALKIPPGKNLNERGDGQGSTHATRKELDSLRARIRRATQTHADDCLSRLERGLGYTNERKAAHGQVLQEPERLRPFDGYGLYDDGRYAETVKNFEKSVIRKYDRALYEYEKSRERLYEHRKAHMIEAFPPDQWLRQEAALMDQIRTYAEAAEFQRRQLRPLEHQIQQRGLFPRNYGEHLKCENKTFPRRVQGPATEAPTTPSGDDRNKAGSRSRQSSPAPQQTILSYHQERELIDWFVLMMNDSWNGTHEQLGKVHKRLELLREHLVNLQPPTEIIGPVILDDEMRDAALDFVTRSKNFTDLLNCVDSFFVAARNSLERRRATQDDYQTRQERDSIDQLWRFIETSMIDYLEKLKNWYSVLPPAVVEYANWLQQSEENVKSRLEDRSKRVKVQIAREARRAELERALRNLRIAFNPGDAPSRAQEDQQRANADRERRRQDLSPSNKDGSLHPSQIKGEQMYIENLIRFEEYFQVIPDQLDSLHLNLQGFNSELAKWMPLRSYNFRHIAAQYCYNTHHIESMLNVLRFGLAGVCDPTNTRIDQSMRKNLDRARNELIENFEAWKVWHADWRAEAAAEHILLEHEIQMQKDVIPHFEQMIQEFRDFETAEYATRSNRSGTSGGQVREQQGRPETRADETRHARQAARSRGVAGGGRGRDGRGDGRAGRGNTQGAGANRGGGARNTERGAGNHSDRGSSRGEANNRGDSGNISYGGGGTGLARGGSRGRGAPREGRG